ncbi:unnamed protein product, partial [Rangifer tarandus platyrhynchus]
MRMRDCRPSGLCPLQRTVHQSSNCNSLRASAGRAGPRLRRRGSGEEAGLCRRDSSSRRCSPGLPGGAA